MGWRENKKIYDQKWIKEHMRRIPLNVKNEDYDLYKAHVSARGESMTAFIKRAMKEQMKRDLESDPPKDTPTDGDSE